MTIYLRSLITFPADVIRALAHGVACYVGAGQFEEADDE